MKKIPVKLILPYDRNVHQLTLENDRNLNRTIKYLKSYLKQINKDKYCFYKKC